MDPANIKRIAHLARLAINEEDINAFTSNLNNIISMVEQMATVDTDHIEPMAHPLDATQRLRPDCVTEHNQRQHYQSMAPAIEAGLYLVPPVIE